MITVYLLEMKKAYTPYSLTHKSMQEPSVLSHTTPPSATQAPLFTRWMRHFFMQTAEVSPDNRAIADLQRRAVWIALALILQSLLVLKLDANINAGSLLPFLSFLDGILPPALILGSFVAMWMALRSQGARRQTSPRDQGPSRWQRAVLHMTIILAIAGSIVGVVTLVMCFQPAWFGNDGNSLDTNAARLLLAGRNPYTDSSILDVARQFAIQPGWTTPLRQGQFAGRLDYPTQAQLQSAFNAALKSGKNPEFESKASYPALSFLTLIPFVFFQRYNVLPFFLLSYLLLVAISWKVTRPALRPWVILLALANVPMWSSTLISNLDIFCYLLIVLAWLRRDNRWYSALFFGLALASKQIAWLFIPFYLVMTWRNDSAKEAAYRIVLAGGLALAINLPFIAWNPHAWLVSNLAPVADPMFPLGVGIINLSVTHLLPYFSGWVYLTLEASAIFACLSGYWYLCRRHPEAAFLLAIVPLFLAWRSLPSYFYCAAFPLFMLMSAYTHYT